MAETTLASVKGRIFNIQRFSIHDGPGIRTTVFLKGCPLRCEWCHNPEGASPRKELSFHAEKCIGCGYCFRVCPRGAHQMVNDKHALDRRVCQVCGSCTQECYAGALEMVGRDVSVEQALEEVLHDKPFYETSGGGLTLSGGEPTLQIEFSEGLLRAAKEAGLHCCVETCGFCDWARIEQLRPLTDYWLYDWKETDPQRHEAWTGVPNARIAENLRRLHDAGGQILLRCPIIPTLNDRPDHLEGVARLALSLPKLIGVEIMPYHRLGTGKRDRIGHGTEATREVEAPDSGTVAQWVATLRRFGVSVLNEP